MVFDVRTQFGSRHSKRGVTTGVGHDRTRRAKSNAQPAPSMRDRRAGPDPARNRARGREATNQSGLLCRDKDFSIATKLTSSKKKLKILIPGNWGVTKNITKIVWK